MALADLGATADPVRSFKLAATNFRPWTIQVILKDRATKIHIFPEVSLNMTTARPKIGYQTFNKHIAGTVTSVLSHSSEGAGWESIVSDRLFVSRIWRVMREELQCSSLRTRSRVGSFPTCRVVNFRTLGSF